VGGQHLQLFNAEERRISALSKQTGGERKKKEKPVQYLNYLRKKTELTTREEKRGTQRISSARNGQKEETGGSSTGGKEGGRQSKTIQNYRGGKGGEEKERRSFSLLLAKKGRPSIIPEDEG